MFTFATHTHFFPKVINMQRNILLYYILNSKQIGKNYATKTQIIGKTRNRLSLHVTFTFVVNIYTFIHFLTLLSVTKLPGIFLPQASTKNNVKSNKITFKFSINQTGLLNDRGAKCISGGLLCLICFTLKKLSEHS